MRTMLAAMMVLVVGCGSEVERPAPSPEAPRPQDEAIQNVKEIAAAAKTALDATRGTAHWGCQSSTPVPAGNGLAGASYQWPAEAPDESWHCLGWHPSQPALRYQYMFVRGVGVVADNPDNSDAMGFEASAIGDLDGDGVVSKFALTGHVSVQTGDVSISPSVYVENEGE